jgi:hypothetical protein
MIMGIADVPALALKIEDYCAARAKVLDLVNLGLGYLREAEEISNAHVPYGFPGDLVGRDDLESVRRKVDGRYWQHALDRTGAAAIMDGEARKQFRDQLQRGDVPAFTMDNVTTHFLSMSQGAQSMFDRGVYNLFHRILRIARYSDYETNKKAPFGVPKKLILDRWFSNGWGSVRFHVNYHSSDEVNDFGRIVSVLAGRPYSPRGFETELNAAMKDNDTFENALIKVRAFGNGNAHIWIKDRELLNRINSRIAAYCGDALPHAQSASYGINTETML